MHQIRTRVRLGAGMLALAVLVGCSPEPEAPTSGPATGPAAAPSALGLGPTTTIPDLHVPGSLELVAGTGARFVITGEPGDNRGQYSLDNGRTWQQAPAELFLRNDMEGRGPSTGNFIGYGGTFLGVRQLPDSDRGYFGFHRWDPATGQVTALDYDLNPPPADDGDDEVWVYPIDYIGRLVLLNDSRIFDVSGQQAFPVAPRLPESPALSDLEWSGLTRDGDYAVGSGEAGDTRYLVIGPTGASGEPVAIELPGLLAVDVSAQKIHYLVGSARSLELCRAEVTTPREVSCVRVASGDHRASRGTVHLSTSDGADQILLVSEDQETVRQWFVRGGRTTLVASSRENWTWLPYRDTEAPMAQVGNADDRTQLAVTLADDGGTTPLFAAPATAASPGEIAVSAGWVIYTQEHAVGSGPPTRYVWTRQLTPEGLGPELLLTDRVGYGLYASGDRAAVQWDRAYNDDDHTIVFYDGLTETGRHEAGDTTWIRTLSGPYGLLKDEYERLGQQVVRIDGHAFDTGQAVALFGSLVVEAGAPEQAAGPSFAVRDLARPGVAPIPLDLPEAATRVYSNTGWQLWGEWVSASYEVADGATSSVLVNYRTGEVVEPGESTHVLALGDGWALLRRYGADGGDGTSWLLVLATGEEVQVADEFHDVSTDGVRTVALTGPDGASVAVVKGLPANSPRLLGAIGADTLTADGEHTWLPQFDLTRPVGSGTLEVADAAGVVVQRIPTAAAPSGSVRGVAWDGRDTGGALVPAGDYTWTLAVTAADGGGAATSVDGLRPASGTLVVTR